MYVSVAPPIRVSYLLVITSCTLIMTLLALLQSISVYAKVIAEAFPVVQHNLVNDEITGAKTAHVHCFDNTRLVIINRIIFNFLKLTL